MDHPNNHKIEISEGVKSLADSKTETESKHDRKKRSRNHYDSSSNKRPLITGIVVVLILALGAVCVWQFVEMNKLRDPNHSAQQAEADARELKEKVSKLMQLPDEDATVATVQDAEKLVGQEFFKDAKNDDKVLIFTEAKKAVIYRPSENRVINSGPIVISSNSPTENTNKDKDKK